MSDYTKTTDFAAKDALPSGNGGKIVKGSELDDEFDNIATAIATKYDSNDRGAANGIAPLDSSSLVPVANLPDATTSADGIVELATSAETITGTDTARAVTPAGVQAVLDQNAAILADLSDLGTVAANRIFYWSNADQQAKYLNPSSTDFTISAGSPDSIAVNDSGIDHDATTNFVANEHINHTSVTLTAGTGLTGGGDISASRSFNLDISGLTNMTVADTAATDSILVNDGGTMKQMDIQDMGLRVVDASGGNQTFALNDANTIQRIGGTDRTFTIPPNSSVAFPIGVVIYLVSNGAGAITVDPGAGVSLCSVFAVGSTDNRTVLPGGAAALIKTASDTWNLVGDIT